MVNKKDWNKAVKEAKQTVGLLRLGNKHRLKVAEIAISVCTIKHGGRAEEDKFSISKFAKAIGINRKTLTEWIRHRKYIHDKLDEVQKETYNELSSDTIKHIMKDIDIDTPVKKLRKKFDKFAKSGPLHSRIYKYIKVLETIIYNVSHFNKIHEITDDHLLQITAKCREINVYIEKEMELRSKKIPRKVLKPKVNFDEFWEKEVGVK